MWVWFEWCYPFNEPCPPTGRGSNSLTSIFNFRRVRPPRQAPSASANPGSRQRTETLKRCVHFRRAQGSGSLALVSSVVPSLRIGRDRFNVAVGGPRQASGNPQHECLRYSIDHFLAVLASFRRMRNLSHMSHMVEPRRLPGRLRVRSPAVRRPGRGGCCKMCAGEWWPPVAGCGRRGSLRQCANFGWPARRSRHKCLPGL